MEIGIKPGIKNFLKELWNRFFDNDISGKAAQLAYYLLFSLFPLLIFLVTVLSLISSHFPQDAVHSIFMTLSKIMPADALKPIQEQWEKLGRDQHSFLSLGLLIALWSASRATDVFRIGLNEAHQKKETRSYIKVQGVAIIVTIVLALLVLFGFSAVLLGGKLGNFLAERIHFHQAYLYFSWLRWPVSALVIMFAVSLAYYILPNVFPRLKFVNIGAAVATILWLFATWGFTQYAESLGDYNATYGSIGGIIVLLTWFYISGLIFLLGGEVNAILQQFASYRKARKATLPS